MSVAGVRIGVGTRFRLDGETVEITELFPTSAGNEVLLKDAAGRFTRMSVRELLVSERAVVIPDGPGPSPDGPLETAAAVLSQLTDAERAAVLERAAHIREVLYGYRSGSPELAAAGEPRPEFEPGLPLMQRYAAKAAELGVDARTVRRWVREFREFEEAGLAPKTELLDGPLAKADPRWVEVALEVMGEHAEESEPSQSIVLRRTAARLTARFGPGEVKMPSRATGYRFLAELDRWVPTFHGSSKRRRDIADRPDQAYGRLRPTRPGEYMLLDTTRSDVFALDPITLRWVQAEITVAMDWYSRCITGLRVTPVSTKAVDASSTLFQAYRPRSAPPGWPEHAVWPEHGIPRRVLLDRGAVEGPIADAAGPTVVPETIVIDHGKIYVSAHLTSVCRRMGISIQPARLRTGRDKGPIERFFRTMRQRLLEALPGYKGPDVFSRGLHAERDAFFFIDELEAIIREWIATDYHLRPHRSLVDPRAPGVRLSPAKMFEHGVARAGYIEAPRDPDLGFEFLDVKDLPIHHYGVETDRRRYNGNALNPYRNQTSGRPSGLWPFHINPDDITEIHFRDPLTRRWHTLEWEHAPTRRFPFSEEALEFARGLAASKYTYPNDDLAVADLLERWDLGLGMSVSERRMALRLAREQAGIVLPARRTPELAEARPAGQADDHSVEAGDDDDESDLEIQDVPGPGPDAGPEDFYATALEDL